MTQQVQSTSRPQDSLRSLLLADKEKDSYQSTSQVPNLSHNITTNYLRANNHPFNDPTNNTASDKNIDNIVITIDDSDSETETLQASDNNNINNNKSLYDNLPVNHDLSLYSNTAMASDSVYSIDNQMQILFQITKQLIQNQTQTTTGLLLT